jgi:DNA methylase
MRTLNSGGSDSTEPARSTPTANTTSTEAGARALVSAVQQLPLARLRCWPENPRTIRPERLEQLKRALAVDPEMLRARPLLALPDGTVIAGNQRLRAARELGWADDPGDHRQPRAGAGAPVGPARQQPVRRVGGAGTGRAPGRAWRGRRRPRPSGFAGRELEQLLAGIEPAADPDEAPPLPSEPESEPGRIYRLGPHRLACGDARDGELLGWLLGDEQPVVLWSDPPYGVGYVGKTTKALRLANDDAEAPALLEAALGVADPLLAPAARFYLAVPARPQGTGFRLALERLGWQHQQTLVWVKNALVLGRSDYHYQHEEILYGFRPGPGRPGRGPHPGSRWYGDDAQSSVFFVDRPARSEAHPTMKPVALITAMLSNSSRRGDPVLDLFAGSGSTLIACEQLGRRCFAVELDPRYCDVIRQRYQDYHDGR